MGLPRRSPILWDAMMNSTLPEDEYTKEQEVIRREFAMGFDDPRPSSQLMLRTVFLRARSSIPSSDISTSTTN